MGYNLNSVHSSSLDGNKINMWTSSKSRGSQFFVIQMFQYFLKLKMVKVICTYRLAKTGKINRSHRLWNPNLSEQLS